MPGMFLVPILLMLLVGIKHTWPQITHKNYILYFGLRFFVITLLVLILLGRVG